MVILIIGNTYSIGWTTQVFTIKNINESGDCVLFIILLIVVINTVHHQSTLKNNAPFIEDGYE
jgi:hypothetical protein